VRIETCRHATTRRARCRGPTLEALWELEAAPDPTNHPAPTPTPPPPPQTVNFNLKAASPIFPHHTHAQGFALPRPLQSCL
jgi:hypothetical protein